MKDAWDKECKQIINIVELLKYGLEEFYDKLFDIYNSGLIFACLCDESLVLFDKNLYKNHFQYFLVLKCHIEYYEDLIDCLS